MSSSAADDRRTEFDVDDCHRLIASQHIGRLVIGDTVPNVRPVNYIAYERHIYFRTERPLPPDAPVAFEVDQIDSAHRQGWSVVAIGNAHALSIDSIPDEIATRLEPWAEGDKPCWSVIRVESITGLMVKAPETPGVPDHRGYL